MLPSLRTCPARSELLSDAADRSGLARRERKDFDHRTAIRIGKGSNVGALVPEFGRERDNMLGFPRFVLVALRMRDEDSSRLPDLQLGKSPLVGIQRRVIRRAHLELAFSEEPRVIEKAPLHDA